MNNHRHLVDTANIVSLDAEWPPEQTRRHKQPQATVVQLAAPTASAHGGPTAVHVLLIDLLRIENIDVNLCRKLIDLFRNGSILKIGYAFPSDLKAVAAAVGAKIGVGCVSLVKPSIDIGYLHRKLLQQGVQGVHRPTTKGLSGLVRAQLGKSLDKSQQCSAWGLRPLTEEQLHYAAGDAVCLLDLFDNLIQNVYNQKDGPFLQSKELVAEASQRYGAPLNPFTSSSVSLHKKTVILSEQKEKEAEEQAILTKMPRYIPWLLTSSDTGSSASAPRFICDVMMDGLARQLRLVGIDAESVQHVEKNQRHLVYRTLVQRAEDEDRVVLTRDKIFLLRGYLNEQTYWVRAESKGDQLKEVMAAFHLRSSRDNLLSRCARCNGEFNGCLPENLPLDHGVPQQILDNKKEFWVCRNCQSVYWQGCQYQRAIERLTDVLQELSV